MTPNRNKKLFDQNLGAWVVIMLVEFPCNDWFVPDQPFYMRYYYSIFYKKRKRTDSKTVKSDLELVLCF